MNIEMKPFKYEELIPEEGKYLIRTVSEPLKTVQYLQARCTIVWDKDNKRYENRADVSNQTVTHISTGIIS